MSGFFVATLPSPDNFSYSLVDVDVVLPYNQQMMIFDQMELTTGELTIDGEAVIMKV